MKILMMYFLFFSFIDILLLYILLQDIRNLFDVLIFYESGLLAPKLARGFNTR